MYKNKLHSTVEGGLMLAIAVIFAIVSIVIPVLGAFFQLFWPIPIVVLGTRHGLKWSAAATLIAGIFIALFLNPVQALVNVLGLGLIGIALGHAFRYDYSPAKTMFIGTICSLISMLMVFAVGFLVTGINPLNMQADSFNEMFKEMSNIYTSLGVKTEDIENLENVGKMFLELLKLAIPALLILNALFTSWFNIVLSRLILLKLGKKVKGFLPYREWLLPNYVAFFFVIAAFLVYFGKAYGLHLTYVMGLNILIIVSMVLFVVGFSLIAYLCYRFKIAKMFLVIIGIVILLNGVLSQALVLLGALDALFDYRKLRKRT